MIQIKESLRHSHDTSRAYTKRHDFAINATGSWPINNVDSFKGYNMGMFCYQCEQTARGTGCTSYGVCGKDPETSSLQDLLITAVKVIGQLAHKARLSQKTNLTVDRFITNALFTTVTNVNFDPKRMEQLLKEALSVYQRALELLNDSQESDDYPKMPYSPEDNLEQLVRIGEEASIEKRIEKIGADITGLQELLIYGLKGTAAYAVHAQILGYEDPAIYSFFHQALSALQQEQSSIDELLKLCLECGAVNLNVMQLLDKAHTETFGNPVPTKVRVTPVKGKAILVSGHDLKDLDELLKQTEGKGVNIYTHGEMLPAHGYPALNKYPHLVGNYGGAWQDQMSEFDAFPGAILMTTNCIQKPRTSYQDRIFTAGLVAWPGIKHIENHDYSAVIAAALNASGFDADHPQQEIMVGFGHKSVLGAAEQIVEKVKSGAIKHFFLIGGCDGAKSGRNYYTDFAKAVPMDCMIMTLACGKYRFNKLEFGSIDGLPRLLDLGQCNDAYSAIKIAVSLAEAFKCGVNELPLSLILSWYEQKAVCILLTLLHLGIKNIKLGPTLPAAITPATLKLLVDNYQIQPLSTVEADLQSCLKRAA